MGNRYISNEQIRINEQIKHLSRKEKWLHFLEYYKLHVAITVIVLLLLGSIVYNIINPPPKPYVQLALFANLPENIMTDLNKRFNDALVVDKEKYVFNVLPMGMSESGDEMAYAVIQKFSAMVAANEIDIIISNEADFKGLSDQQYFADLTTVFTPAELEKISDLLTSNTSPYGIRLDGNKFFLSEDLNTNGYIMGVLINSQRIENTKATINYILDYVK